MLLFLIFYIALYAIWPFNMSRFWSPILPIMLVFLLYALRHFLTLLRRPPVTAALAALLLSLLITLNFAEMLTHLGEYQRRLNYVSDAMADAAQTVTRLSPDPQQTLIAVAGDDEHLIFDWYFLRTSHTDYITSITSPIPHIGTPNGPREDVHSFFKRTVDDFRRSPSPKRLFLINIFNEPRYADYFGFLRTRFPETFNSLSLQRRYSRGSVSEVWEVLPKSPNPPNQ